jgi:glycosyltransferase involved in cell wall biosynthesis
MLSLIFPAYNESKVIAKNLTHVVLWLKSQKIEAEIIVVDDGSSDKTVAEVKKIISRHKEVSLIENQHRGKSYAVYVGVLASKGQYVLVMDVDLATPVEEYHNFSKEMKKGFDIVIASREAEGSKRVGEPYLRHFIGRVFNLFVVQLFALPGINDSQCGFKLFKGDMARKIFKKLIVYGPESKVEKKPFFGALDVEVLFIARSMGLEIRELGVEWHYAPTTRLSFFNNAFKMARDVLRIRLNGLLGKY